MRPPNRIRPIFGLISRCHVRRAPHLGVESFFPDVRHIPAIRSSSWSRSSPADGSRPVKPQSGSSTSANQHQRANSGASSSASSTVPDASCITASATDISFKAEENDSCMTVSRLRVQRMGLEGRARLRHVVVIDKSNIEEPCTTEPRPGRERGQPFAGNRQASATPNKVCLGRPRWDAEAVRQRDAIVDAKTGRPGGGCQRSFELVQFRLAPAALVDLDRRARRHRFG